MTTTRLRMPVRRRSGLLAHDRRNEDLLARVAFDEPVLPQVEDHAAAREAFVKVHAEPA